MSAISDKHRALLATGIDLGAARGPEEAAGFGGRRRLFARGAIYSHANAGTHYVSGGMQGVFDDHGGVGFDPEHRRRAFGFPTEDPGRSKSGDYPAQAFEFGAIHWVPSTGGVYVHGPLRQSFDRANGDAGALGAPLAKPAVDSQGEVSLFARGCLFQGAASSNRVVRCLANWPLIGQPTITGAVRPGRIAARALQLALPRLFAGDLEVLARRMETIWANRLWLKPSGGASGPSVRLVLRDREIAAMPAFGSRIHWALHCDRPLKDRTLYDLLLERPDRKRIVLSPNCVYAQDHWADFTLMHVSDLHASRRTETFRPKLTADSRKAFINYNDGIRAIIKAANRLHRQGKLDAIMATGDLVDYVFESDDNRQGTGNFGFLVKLLTGQVRDSTGRAGPKLRVPIFMSPGNHDYRVNPYDLFFDIDVPLKSDPTISNYGPHNLTEADARRLQGNRKPTVSRSKAQGMVKVDKELIAYRRTIARQRSFSVGLGTSRVVMIDSRWDAGILDTFDAIIEWLGFGTDDQRNFAAGHPNSVGVQASDVTLLKRALDEAGDRGSVIVGIHAPPLNLAGNEYPYYFRETLQPARSRGLVLDFHNRQAKWTGAIRQFGGMVTQIPKGWADLTKPHFKKGGLKGIDVGVSKGKIRDFLDLCLGIGATRKVDLVLSGHVHKNVEFRLGKSGKDYLFFTDFYSAAPKRYYPTKIMAGAIHIDVAESAPVRGQPRTVNNHSSAFNAKSWRKLATPPYRDPLNETSNPRAWWQRHAPVLVQTAPTGPFDANNRDLDEPKPFFRGYRLIQVKDGRIARMAYEILPVSAGRGVTGPPRPRPRPRPVAPAQAGVVG